jgi:hypothetical protein
MTRVAPRPPGRTSNALDPRPGWQPSLSTGAREGGGGTSAVAADSRRAVRLPSLAFLALGDPLPSDYYLG